MLHTPVVFIGDKPSKKNVSKTTPFVGTSSYKKLLAWMGDMDLDFTLCNVLNSSDLNAGHLQVIKAYHGANMRKVVCLGEVAAEKLKKAGVQEFYTLPHPSGRNRKLNDQKFVSKCLKQCAKYVYERN